MNYKSGEAFERIGPAFQLETNSRNESELIQEDVRRKISIISLISRQRCIHPVEEPTDQLTNRQTDKREH